MQNVEHPRKKMKKKHNVDLAAASQEHMDGKLCNESNLMGEHEVNEYSIEIKVGREKIKDYTIKKVKKKKSKSVENGYEGKRSEREQKVSKGVKHTSPSENFTPQGISKRVSFFMKSWRFSLYLIVQALILFRKKNWCEGNDSHIKKMRWLKRLF